MSATAAVASSQIDWVTQSNARLVISNGRGSSLHTDNNTKHKMFPQRHLTPVCPSHSINATSDEATTRPEGQIIPSYKEGILDWRPEVSLFYFTAKLSPVFILRHSFNLPVFAVFKSPSNLLHYIYLSFCCSSFRGALFL